MHRSFFRRKRVAEEFNVKIAFIDEDLSPRTGSRRFTFEIARVLETNGHEVGIFTGKLDRSSCFEEYLSLPVHVYSNEKAAVGESLGGHARGYMRNQDNIIFNVAKHLNYWLSQANLVMKMSKKIADSNYDIAMVHYHGEHWLMPYFYYLVRSPAAIYLNVSRRLRRSWGLPFQELQELPLHRQIADKALLLPPVGRWEKASHKKVRLLIAPSQHLLRQAERQGMLRQKESAVVPLGVNHSEFSPTGEEEDFALYAGRIHPHKSLELAVAAMKETSKDKSLVIAGDITREYLWYKEKLIRLAEKMKVAGRIRIIESPPDSEIVRLMQRCSVFLFPSTIDTFGLVVLEAMACGKPIIACNRGGVPEVVGDAGFLLEPSIQQWRKTVNRVLSDSELRYQMQEKSLSRSKCFSWERTTEKLLASFANAINAA
jgi:glycosyltransferase involved in cell wall biosynthesis